MVNTFKKSKEIYRVLAALLLILIFAACSPAMTDLTKTVETAPVTPAAISETKTPDTEQPVAPAAPPGYIMPGKLAKISLENLQDIGEQAAVFPYVPPYYQFSNDGSRIAVGDMQTVEIWDAASDKVISSIPALLPDCDFGFDRYFRLNADGTFIALVNGQSIQVWQVGGGLIYESPLFSGFTSNAPTCGVDFPELALSPDGRLLAVSGMAYSSTSVKRFFRVVDILSNTVVYEWNGNNNALHGNLYTFYGLGFSDDGKLLQTFDPLRFIRSEGNVQQAFRFWSVGDWLEVERASPLVEESFQPGQLLFPWSDSGAIEIRSKVTGDASAKINSAGCEWDSPCETRFSDDGGLAVVLNHAGEKIQYKNDNLHSSISIRNLANNQEIRSESGMFRDLEGVLAQGSGKLLRADQLAAEGKGSTEWWTFKDHFSGLQSASDGSVKFTPLVSNSNNSQDCQFCDTCSIDSEMGEITCSEGIVDSEGERITLKKEGGQFVLVRQSAAEATVIGEIALPKEVDLSKTRVRLLGYSMPQQTLFYCVDENLRQEGCYIFDPYMKKALAAPEDISFLRLSPNGSKAVFINRKVNALFFYDLSTRSLARKYAYQARAYPVNPVFSNDGSTLYYVIQNLNNASDLSVEILDAQTAKSLSRVSLKKAGITTPTVFSISSEGSFWVFAGKNGEVTVISPEKGVLLHRWQAHTDGIVGMAIASDQQWLLTMGENGILKYWGVEE
jgi:WD40 repeat protein